MKDWPEHARIADFSIYGTWADLEMKSAVE